jgi:hypothetical protein
VDPAGNVTAVRLLFSATSHGPRLIKFSGDQPRMRALFGPLASAEFLSAGSGRFTQCIMRYLLAPTAHLRRLERRHAAHVAPYVVPLAAHAAEHASPPLLNSVVMHVRLGDAAILSATATSTATATVAAAPPHALGWGASPPVWQFASHRSSRSFSSDPVGAFRCLASALRVPEDGGCLPCFVLSDTAGVVSCASSLLGAAPVSGTPVHLLASTPSRVTDQNVDKLFLEWWLIARSRGAITFVPHSSFSNTATAFREASAADGFTIRVEPSRFVVTRRTRGWRAPASSRDQGTPPAAGERGPQARHERLPTALKVLQQQASHGPPAEQSSHERRGDQRAEREACRAL